jgi:hypothetical protein
MEELAASPDLPVVEQKNNGMYNPTPEQSLAGATEAVARALVAVDPAAALAMARKIKGSTRPGMPALALALAARQLKGEASAKAFREAIAAAGEEYWGGDTMARIAALAYEVDPVLGEELFLATRRRLDNSNRISNTTMDDENMRPSYAAYAFYRAPIDPAESRLLLEEEWTRRIASYERAQKDRTANTYSNIGWQLNPLVRAMVAVDLERALEMASEAAEFEGQRNDVRPLIIAYILTSTQARRTMPFEQYLSDDR